jgi:hypothetical protein
MEETEDNEFEYGECAFSKVPSEYYPLVSTAEAQATVAKESQHLLKLLTEFRDEHPTAEVFFLLAHSYPSIVGPEGLKTKDLELYNLLSKGYNLEIGIAINAYATDYEGSVTQEETHSLTIFDHAAIAAMLEGSVDWVQNPDTPRFIFFGNSANFEKVKSQEYNDYTGNEAAIGEYVYRSMVLQIVIKK